MENKANTSKAKQHSQSTFVQTVKDWLTPEAIKELKRNQAITKKVGDKAIKK